MRFKVGDPVHIIDWLSIDENKIYTVTYVKNSSISNQDYILNEKYIVHEEDLKLAQFAKSPLYKVLTKDVK